MSEGTDPVLQIYDFILKRNIANAICAKCGRKGEFKQDGPVQYSCPAGYTCTCVCGERAIIYGPGIAMRLEDGTVGYEK